ncbi:hypothetical protein Y592_01415 [Thermosipho sp. 1070]|nr:hypothetical protein [Thermosipho sp. 1063]ANQ54561.1 hypothetical protein Y592_01415 [Thermosipho sp. 1070]
MFKKFFNNYLETFICTKLQDVIVKGIKKVRCEVVLINRLF